MPLPTTNGLPRPIISNDTAVDELVKGNVIFVIENNTDKLDLLRLTLSQRVVHHQSLVENGTRGHRVVLFVVDDNQSIGQYAHELKELGVSVESYTVDMHSAGPNQWPKIIHNEIIVVTANLLLDSLSDGSLRLSQAHMLVISDAQRVVPTVTPHPVLRILSDLNLKTTDLPRVLALFTCSPDRWASLDLAWLETPLQAQTFFMASKPFLSSSGPVELVMEYEVVSIQKEPSMSGIVRKADPECLLVGPQHYRRSRRICSQLGSFATNCWWREILDGIISSPASEHLKNSVARDGLELIKNHGIAEKLHVTPDSSGYNVTPKFSKLLQLLQPYASYGDQFRCIVFVEDRVVASVLPKLLHTARAYLPFIRAITLGRRAMVEQPSLHIALSAFSSGEFNLLVLTKSMEDIELPPASLIVNFDVFDDQLSYAYNRLHARGKQSHIVYLVEKRNNEQRRALCRLRNVDAELEEWIGGLFLHKFNAPPKSTYVGLNPYQSDSDFEEEDCILDAVTSARVGRSQAIPSFYRFAIQVHALPLPGAEDDKVVFNAEINDDDAAAVRYTISFPKFTAISTLCGPYRPTRWEARREACYQACKALFQVGIMDHRHFPQSQRAQAGQNGSTCTDGEPPAPDDVKTANTSLKTHGYPRKFPEFWRNTQLTPLNVLYPTVVAADDMGGEFHAPVLLLARAPIPHVPEFPLFFSGMRTLVRFHQATPINITDAQLRALHGYTLRVTKSLTNKPLDCTFGDLLCYFSPLGSSWNSNKSTQWPLFSVEEHILWEDVQLAADHFAVRLLDKNIPIDERARDAIVLDRQVEFTMRHFVVKVRHDLTPLCKAEDSPRESGYSNFLEYCKTRCRDFQGLEDENQPMIEVGAVPGVINNLHPTSAPPTPPAKAPLKYLIPEMCYKFTIPASTFRTLWLMPSIMNKIESYLLVKELNAKLFHNAVIENQLLVALSTPAAWTELNYERLEFLGDSFLKVVASNFCYATMPSSHVGDLHQARQSIISNKVLQEGAMRVGVPSYIQHKRFVAKLWQPPLSTPGPNSLEYNKEEKEGKHEKKEPYEKKDKGKRSKKQRQLDEQNTLWMGDKIIADVVEAILAASFLTGGHETALEAARRLLIPIPNVAQWSDYARLAAEYCGQQPTAAKATIPSSTVNELEHLFGSKFSRLDLLAQALTHTSAFSGVGGTSYDRLEFIGDAILDFQVSRFIWERYPYLSPGGLTMLKGAMVSNQTLAAFCVHVGLQQFLRLESKELDASIHKYAEYLEDLRKQECALASREQRQPGQYWLDVPMEPPKCLSDIVESLIGALYVSDNFFEVGVGRFFETVFKPFLEAYVRLQTLSTNPKVTLLELLQAEGCHKNAVVKQSQSRQNMPVQMDVVIHGRVVASETDSSAAIASRKVSLAALDILANNPELLAQMCDCRSATPNPSKINAPITQTIQSDILMDEEAEAAEVEAFMVAGEA